MDPKDIIIENGETVPTRLPLATEKQAKRTKRRFVSKLLKVAGHIPFADDAAAAYYCAIDPNTPHRVRLILFAALGYFVMPIDALPDVMAGLGFSDDASVLAATLGIVGMHITEQHRHKARQLLGLPIKPRSTEAQPDGAPA